MGLERGELKSRSLDRAVSDQDNLLQEGRCGKLQIRCVTHAPAGPFCNTRVNFRFRHLSDANGQMP